MTNNLLNFEYENSEEYDLRMKMAQNLHIVLEKLANNALFATIASLIEEPSAFEEPLAFQEPSACFKPSGYLASPAMPLST